MDEPTQPQPRQPQPEQPTAPDTQVAPKRSWKSFIIAIIAVLIIGGGAYGYTVWQGNQSAETVIPAFTPRQTEDSMSDWKTYTNEEYGFEFKYPNDWAPDRSLNINPLKDYEFVNAPAGETYKYNSETQTWTVSEYAPQPRTNFVRWYYAVIVDIGVGHFALIPDIRSGAMIQIHIGERVCFEEPCITTSGEENLNQILSTFKFIEREIINSYQSCVAAGNAIIKTKPPKCQSSEGLVFVEYESCVQVIASARNPETGQERDFPTPCDVPEGWIKQ